MGCLEATIQLLMAAFLSPPLLDGIRRLVEPPPLALIRDGKLQRKAMRQELISSSELETKLREHGIEKLDDIKVAYLEDDGEISVLRRDGQEPEQPSRRSPGKSPV
jgi:uncharacterized membrane protein YcaP (DUF421 family)